MSDEYALLIDFERVYQGHQMIEDILDVVILQLTWLEAATMTEQVQRADIIASFG